jgi:hypothetical protein
MPARSSGLGLRLLWRPLGFSLNNCVCYMNINFPRNVFTLTITFIILNVSTEFVLIYCLHPVLGKNNDNSVSPPTRSWSTLVVREGCGVLHGHVPPLVLPVPHHVLSKHPLKSLKVPKCEILVAWMYMT